MIEKVINAGASHNKIFTLRACLRVIAATPFHRTYAAKGMGFGGSVCLRRKTETLGNTLTR